MINKSVIFFFEELHIIISIILEMIFKILMSKHK